MDGRISNFEQMASVRRYVITEGRGKDLEVIDCDNGRLRFLLNVSKACDMMQLYDRGQNMSFVSKNGFTKRELPFLKRFEGGMLYTCGLDVVGDREGLDEHGTLHNIPAEILRAECTEDGILVEAVIRDTEICGKNLVIRRQIFSEIGSDRVTVRDRLTNESYRQEEYCLLYHVNLGYPMVDAGARVVTDAGTCLPRTPWAEENMDTLFDITVPMPNREETCYYFEDQKPEVSLVNEKLGKIFTVSYSGATLPNFLLWKNMMSGDYAVGLEPCTTKLDHLLQYSKLKAGETVEFYVDIRIHDTKQ